MLHLDNGSGSWYNDRAFKETQMNHSESSSKKSKIASIAESTFWVFISLYIFVALYGSIGIEIKKSKMTCTPPVNEVIK